MQALSGTWPWYISGPLIGLIVPILLVLGNRQFGVSGSLRTICAAVLPGKADFFRYDWKTSGSWSLAFVGGTMLGGMIAARVFTVPIPAISMATRDAVAALGIHDVAGLAPVEVFSWAALLSVRGFVSMVVGGFLVGFGTAYAGGCTSGHGITGLAALQRPSLVALIGFFVGGLVATFGIIPALYSL